MSAVYIRTWPARYELLDGLRGLASLGVLFHHLGVAPIGHYSVMVFFVISGYCITASAHSSLRRGATFATYMWRRARRIYPPYLIAVVFFAITRLIKSSLSNGPPWHPTGLDWVQNLTLTQWLSMPFHPAVWPDQNPKLFVAAFWSLNYEEQFYLVTGLLLILAIRYRVSLVSGVLALAVLGFAWNMVIPGGWICGFFIEYWAHFALGASLYFVLCLYPVRMTWIAFLTILATLAVYCAAHVWSLTSDVDFQIKDRAYVELGFLSVVSISLLLARPFSARVSRSLPWRPIVAIGTVSYSLYLVHQFNLTLVGTVAGHIVPAGAPTVVLISAKVLLHLSIAALFWYLFERPFLNHPRTAAESSKAISSGSIVVERQS